MMRRLFLALLCAVAWPAHAQVVNQGPTISVTTGLGPFPVTAAQTQFLGPDGSPQFFVGLIPGAAEYFDAMGGLTGNGATLLATNGTTGPVAGNFAAQETGGFNFGNGAGQLFGLLDPGAPSTAWLTVKPGTATTDPVLGSTGNADIDAPAGSAVFFTNGGIVMGAAKNIKSIGATTNYPVLFGATGATGMACVNTAGSGAVNCFIQAQSTGSVSFGNTSGSLATYANSNANTAVDFLVVKASSSTDPIKLGGNANTSVAVGTPALTANATVGFAGMPTCAGAAGPTGVPAQTTGWGMHCYNPTTHMLNIYDPVAASWYHVAMTAGAG